MSTSTKVYCEDCEYYKHCLDSKCFNTYDSDNLHERCEAPSNLKTDYKTSNSDKYISCPSIINKFNNCTWYKEKETVDLTISSSENELIN